MLVHPGDSSTLTDVITINDLRPLGYRYVDRSLPGGIAKIDRRRPIEGEKGKKKKRKRRKKKEERRKNRRRRKNTSRHPRPRAVVGCGLLARRRRPRPWVARELSPPSPVGRPRAVAALAPDFSPVRGERSRRHRDVEGERRQISRFFLFFSLFSLFFLLPQLISRGRSVMVEFQLLLPNTDPVSLVTGSKHWYRLVEGDPCVENLSD
ncbi:hypothetical protein GW17_00052358 [Ensete ventricosum]|nr:hypothetical protein GW17_00052358 [Ensete ventricosum]